MGRKHKNGRQAAAHIRQAKKRRNDDRHKKTTE